MNKITDSKIRDVVLVSLRLIISLLKIPGDTLFPFAAPEEFVVFVYPAGECQVKILLIGNDLAVCQQGYLPTGEFDRVAGFAQKTRS